MKDDLPTGFGGMERSRKVAPYLWFVLVLVVLDLATKVASYGLLPQGQGAIRISDGIRLILVVNKTGVPRYDHDSGNWPGWVGVIRPFALLVMSPIVIYLAQVTIKTNVRIMIGIGCYLVLILAALLLEFLFFPVPKPLWFWASLGRLGWLVLALAVMMVSNGMYFKVCFGLGAAGSAGNLLSVFYPPYGIVDFIHVRWLQETLGIPVFNVADACLFVANAMLAATPAYFFMLFIRRLIRSAHTRKLGQ